MNTEYSTQTISSSGPQYPSTTEETDPIENQKFISKIKITILSSYKLLKVDISKHQKKKTLKKLKKAWR